MPVTLKQWLELTPEKPWRMSLAACENGVEEGFYARPEHLRSDGMLDTYVYPEDSNDEIIVIVNPNDYIVDTFHWDQHMDSLTAIVKKVEIVPITKEHMIALENKRKEIGIDKLFKDMRKQLSSEMFRLEVIVVDYNYFRARYHYNGCDLILENDKPIVCDIPYHLADEKTVINAERGKTIEKLIEYINQIEQREV